MVLSKTLKTYWLPVLVHVGALVPLALLIRYYSQDAFIIDPVQPHKHSFWLQTGTACPSRAGFVRLYVRRIALFDVYRFGLCV
jgi:hypothetical protein